MLDINKNTKKITFVQGDTVDFDVTASNYAFETGDTVHFTVKKIGGDNVIEKEITTFTDGVANITLTAAESNIAPSNSSSVKYRYDIQCDLADGTIDTVVIGDLVVNEGVTV